MTNTDKQKRSNKLKAVGIALGLPSYILGVAAFCYILVSKNIISMEASLGIFLVVLFYSIYLMVRYAIK